jgi:O-methyltransferase
MLASRLEEQFKMPGGGIGEKSSAAAVRDLYLDLLVKSISNLIYGSVPSDTWNDGLFRPDAKPGRDRDSPAHSMVGLLRLQNVRELAQRAIDEGIPGDFIETGVWRGGCCILMRGVLAANLVADRKVYVADSFAGLPPPSPTLFPVDSDSSWHTMLGLAVSLDEVRDNFKRYDLLDDHVVFVKGFFSDTLPKLDAGPFAIIRLDGDMYESTYVALQSLYPKVSPGGFVIIDDYGAIAQCRQAVDDYLSAHSISDAIHQIDSTGVWWQKSG